MSEAAPAIGGQGVMTDASPTVSPVTGNGAYGFSRYWKRRIY